MSDTGGISVFGHTQVADAFFLLANMSHQERRVLAAKLAAHDAPMADEFAQYITDTVFDAAGNRCSLQQTAPRVKQPWRLTRAEFEIVQRVCRGQPTAEISLELSITPKTVATHLGNIFIKMDVYDRLGVVLAVLHHPLARASFFPELQIDSRREVGSLGSRTDRRNEEQKK